MFYKSTYLSHKKHRFQYPIQRVEKTSYSDKPNCTKNKNYNTLQSNVRYIVSLRKVHSQNISLYLHNSHLVNSNSVRPLSNSIPFRHHPCREIIINIIIITFSSNSLLRILQNKCFPSFQRSFQLSFSR